LRFLAHGIRSLTWNKDSFAFAESYDERAGRYRGLRCGQMAAVSLDDTTSLLVKPEIAQKQTDTETAMTSGGPTAGGETAGPQASGQTAAEGGKEPGASVGPSRAPARPKRFYGTVALDAARVGRDAGRIADEVIAHLSGLVGSSVKATLEIEADVSSGVPDNVVRTVTENSRTLKFNSGAADTSGRTSLPTALGRRRPIGLLRGPRPQRPSACLHLLRGRAGTAVGGQAAECYFSGSPTEGVMGLQLSQAENRRICCDYPVRL
jgi:hypothetical protein